MDTTNTSQLWKIVLGEIQTEVSEANFMTLFKKTSLVSLDENTATIAAPSTMINDMIHKRFLPIIKKSLDKHTQKDISIVFTAKTIEAIKEKDDKNGPLFNIPEEPLEKRSQPVLAKTLSRVRSEFTFETLAVSSSNQLAFVSGQTVAKNPGKSYNPLFIYGPVGVGKTHLMQAIANEVYRKNPDSRIIYITSEEFTNEVVEAIRTNDTARMKRKFRTVDLLIIDDVQFIAGKDRVQEELFHTFNILIDNAAQIVLSSDRPPQEIKKLEKRLSSRFAAGLMVDVEEPDFELRSAVVLIKAKKYGVDISIDVAKIIAEKTEDIRSLEGVLLRVITEAKTVGEEITPEFAQEVFGRRKKTEQQRLHPDDVIKTICAFYDIKPTQIKGPKRDARLVHARQIAMYILKTELKLTHVEIGNMLGGRDHTTIMYGVEKIEALVSNKGNETAEILGITKTLFEDKIA